MAPAVPKKVIAKFPKDGCEQSGDDDSPVKPKAKRSISRDENWMGELITIVSEVEGALRDIKVSDNEVLRDSIPRIVAIGTQSSGKSSVLENIVGRGFFPRKNGICTRRPLRLELMRTEEEITDSNGRVIKEWAVFGHSDRKFVKMEDIHEEIENETLRGCNNSETDISVDEILLTFYSQNVSPLTIVDLPGVTRIAREGQSENIEQEIKAMIKKYIEPENTIILAVTAANTDFTTSEAVQMAKEVDPELKRTLAVLTKLDLMDEGTNAEMILSGNHDIKINLGIIGVVCRSQADLNSKKSLVQALQTEREFFMEHYPQYAKESGTEHLRHELARLLKENIKTCLPQLREKINKEKRKYEEKLEKLGNKTEPSLTMFANLLSKFASAYQKRIEGDGEVVYKNICGGAKINEIFFEKFQKNLDSVKPLEGVTREEVRNAINNICGPEPPIFIPDKAVFELVKQQLPKLQTPSTSCADSVEKELKNILQDCMTEEYEKFPTLRERIFDVVMNKIKERMEPTKRQIKDLIACERAFVNVKNPYFKEPMHAALKGDGSYLHYANDKDNEKCALVENLTKKFFEMIKLKIADSVPKAIMFYLVNNVKDSISDCLISEIYKTDEIDSLLAERSDIAEKRRKWQQFVDALEEAEKKIMRVD